MPCPIFTEDNNGNTPLHKAISNGNVNTVRALLSTFKINPLLVNQEGKTIFDIIPKINQNEIQSLLHSLKNQKTRIQAFTPLQSTKSTTIPSETTSENKKPPPKQHSPY